MWASPTGRGGRASASFDWPLLAIGEYVVGIAGAHDAGAGQRQGDAGGVYGDPPPPPLLRDVEAVVPEPQVGSSTRSPGSVVIRMQRLDRFS